jgi:hypothetical protein
MSAVPPEEDPTEAADTARLTRDLDALERLTATHRAAEAAADDAAACADPDAKDVAPTPADEADSERVQQAFVEVLDMEALHAWDRMEIENAAQFAAFVRYRDLPPSERSVRRAYQEELAARGESERDAQAGYLCQSWRLWARKYRWEARAAEWDTYQDKLNQEKWMRRRREQREMEWNIAQDLIEKARLMLKFPVSQVRHVSEDGRQITIVSPTDWKLSDIAKLVNAASRIARLSANMATSHERVSVDELDERIERELARLAAGQEGSIPRALTGPPSGAGADGGPADGAHDQDDDAL